MMSKELRFFEFEIRADHDESHGNVLTGVPIVYDQKTDLGDFYEVIERGALRSADLRDVAFLVNHDTSMIPLARSRNNNANSTMQFSIDDMGMAIRVDLDTENNTDARSLYSAVSRGDITGMSFMFTVDKAEWQDIESEKPTRHIRSISRVMEVSAVTFPAYKQTSIVARGLANALDSAKAELDSERAKHNEEVRQAAEAESNRLRNINLIKLMLEVSE